MPKWTQEQLDAINKSGTNIIVSAGAGSGKTAVLTERVIEKLKQGIKINELLILTFTNAAAGEMKDRIRRKISEHEDLLENLDYLDAAYITTFDSYTLSLVKKYNYILNVSPNLSIVDAGIINIIKEDYLNQVFDELYEEENPLFLNLLNDFCIKNDESLKNALFKIIGALELKSNKEEYLNSYLINYFSKEKITGYVNEFNNLIREELKSIESNLLFISEYSEFADYYELVSRALEKLVKSKDYDEVLNNIGVVLPRRPKDSEEIKIYKDNIDASIKTIKGYLRFENTLEIYETFAIMKKYIEIIIEIIQRFDKKIMAYKNKYDLYEFTDIELMAIKLLKENESIREEIKNFYREICVDEYQDTNDLQEEFIKLIENNNVYMVGDIKQSIYGFRNANPKIFKDKYDKYSKNDGGIKIDLLKNFRSRSNVLKGINDIFSLIMDDSLGGANYILSHQMVFGNMNYEEHKNEKQNYDLEIYNYSYEDKLFTKEEIEAFIIGKDILNKIKNRYEVIDKFSNNLRGCRYEDFCIIMDRGTSFPIYNKIFEYLGIPLQIYEDKKLTHETDLLLLNNILGFILKIRDNIKDTDFKYYFMSIARSHLFRYDDNTIFNVIKDNNYENTEIYEIAKNISQKLDSLNSYEILKEIVKDFNYYKNSIKVGNVEETIIRINNLFDISKNISEMGYTPIMFKDYISKMIAGKNEIKYKGGSIVKDSVKIMNIHKSKGLEFPICYFSGYHKEFNTMDIKERFIYDNKYGIITPFFKEGIGFSILKDLVKDRYFKDNISEEIRLFYVALTRAKEKMIIVTNLCSEEYFSKTVVDYAVRRHYNSFLSMLNSINGNLKNYIKYIDLDLVGLTKNYMFDLNNTDDLKGHDTLKIQFKNVNISNTVVDKLHASKEISKIITEEESKLLEYGTFMHSIFETTNFFNVSDDNLYKMKIENFVKKLGITKDTKVYKEHEFVYEDDLGTYNGIIDLVLIDDQEIKIVDYKLKNIDDPKYIEQLKVYYKYLKSLYDKEIKTYLYSIVDDELKEVNIK